MTLHDVHKWPQLGPKERNAANFEAQVLLAKVPMCLPSPLFGSVINKPAVAESWQHGTRSCSWPNLIGGKQNAARVLRQQEVEAQRAVVPLPLYK